MLAPWNDSGIGGLRIVVDCGMQDLMVDSERRSLVTQLQLSYAEPLRLAVEAVEKCWNENDEEQFKNEYPASESKTKSETQPLTAPETHKNENANQARVTMYDRVKIKATRAIRKFHEANASTVDGENMHSGVKNFQRAPLRLLFSSLVGSIAEDLDNDKGSKHWFVHKAGKTLNEAVKELLSDDIEVNSLGGANDNDDAPANDSPENEIVVLSPDAELTFDVNKPIDHTKIYVVGGLCDYSRVYGATLNRAIESNITAMRLPIPEALGRNASVNILTVNQCVEVLARVALNDGDWKEALLETLPKRKLETMKGVGGCSVGF
tara:strand:- start:6866 stop:7831 length:966 start_codon:yes stop_codon:yes gene_type:complete